MKRELAFALESQSQLIGSLGRTRSSKVQSSALNEVSETRSRKRLKGSIVRCQAKSESTSLVNGFQETSETDGSIDPTQETKVRVGQCDEITVYTRNRRFKSAKSMVVHADRVVETLTSDETKCNLPTSMCENDSRVELAEANGGTYKHTVNEGDLKGVVQMVGKKDVPVEAPRRFTRSALKPKAVQLEDSVSLAGESGGFGNGDNETILQVEGNETGAVNESGNLTKKLELKMSQKIALVKPTTVKELFETGLLEGYSVIHNGGKKGPLLRGTIKDTGIVCSCSLCKGSRVITPSQFEVHACKVYRRAAQYICLENGKSLLQVVNACKNSPLDSLAETIQNVIGPLPVKESIICQNCKGSFLATFAAKVGRLCESCMDSKNSQPTPTHSTGTKARTLKPALALKRSSRIVEVSISSNNQNQAKMDKMSLKPALVPKSSGSASAHILSQKRSRGKTTKKSSKSDADLRSLGSGSVRISSRNNSQMKRTKKLMKPALVARSWESSSANISASNKSIGNISKKSSKSVLIPRSSKSTCPIISPRKKSQWKITKKDQRMHKLVFEEGGLLDGTEVAYYSKGQKLLEGYKKGSGIFCRCCHSEVSPSQFEAHAGWASRKKPYGYIYTSNGVSLHEFAISLLKRRKNSPTNSDDLCTICADGGNLLLCDGCPRAFHIECASLSSIPRGKWYCKYCESMFQREKFVERNANAVAAGRVSGVDPIEQITTRCIRIVKSPENAEVIACVLCRGYDFSKSGFGPRTVILCDQCEKEYHVGCLKKHKMADLKELPNGKWFCCVDCRRIYSTLQNVLIGGEEKLPDSLLNVIKKKHGDKYSADVMDFDVRWRLLTGKIASRETRLLLAKAVAIFHDCFDPIVDSVTGRDFIPSMVYGRNIRGQDFGGMYCAVLTVNSSVVSAAIFRVFGRGIAELPLVATSNGNHGKGYFQILFSCIEKLLAFLNVRNLVLPAAEEAESIWTHKFGFERIPPEQLTNYRRTCWQMLTFQGTSMLQKVVPQCRIINQDVAGSDVPVKSS